MNTNKMGYLINCTLLEQVVMDISQLQKGLNPILRQDYSVVGCFEDLIHKIVIIPTGDLNALSQVLNDVRGFKVGLNATTLISHLLFRTLNERCDFLAQYIYLAICMENITVFNLEALKQAIQPAIQARPYYLRLFSEMIRIIDQALNNPSPDILNSAYYYVRGFTSEFQLPEDPITHQKILAQLALFLAQIEPQL